jgi:hypothetical protein
MHAKVVFEVSPFAFLLAVEVALESSCVVFSTLTFVTRVVVYQHSSFFH